MALDIVDTKRAEVTELGQWLTGIFKDWSTNRRDLEEKWQRNRDAFRGIDNVSWTDSDEGDHEDALDGDTFPGKKDWHSKHTVRITKQKVMTAFALVVDAVLQGGKIPFLLKLAGELAINHEAIPPDMAEAVEKELDDMTQRIQQQFSRCDAVRHFSRAVLCAAIYGRCWVKFHPQTFTKRRMVPLPQQPQVDQSTGEPVIDQQTGQPVPAPDEWTIENSVESGPGMTFISIWDIFSDLEGDDPRTSGGVIHRQYLSSRQFREMARDGEGWNAKAVKRVLAESKRDAPAQGDSDSEMLPRLRDVSIRKNVVRVLECWVQVPRTYAERYEANKGEENPDDDGAITGDQTEEAERSGDDIPCLVVMAGDEIVRFQRLEESEPWPFYSVPWEEDLDEATTYGVADNLAETQAILNSAVRAFEDNKRFSSSLIMGVKRGMLMGKWDGKVKPGMALEVSDTARSISDAISAFVVPDVGNSLMPLIEMFVQFADEEAMLPKIMAGGSDNQQTAREAMIRVEKGGKYVGQVVKNFDDYLIGPTVQDFYEWNMLDPEVKTGKGAYDITPLGFTSFQDRVMRLQSIQQFLAIVLADSELRKLVKLDDALREICKALDLDPEQWLRSVKEIQAAAQDNPEALAQALAVEGEKANIDKTKAETEKLKTDAVVAGERLKIDRAEAVQGLMAPAGAKNATPTA